jgi:AbrB family looped-hinge helix DNA binding protein
MWEHLGDCASREAESNRALKALDRDSALTRREVRRYLTFVKTTVSSKGQIVLPAELREMDNVRPGEEFEVERLDFGDYRVTRRAATDNMGIVDWLLACPHKDFFQPVNSESTNTL